MRITQSFVTLSLMCLPFMLVSGTASAAQTSRHEIVRTQMNGDSQTIFFAAASGWGAAGCENATYVTFKAGMTGYEAMLSLALTAFAAGLEVQFSGDCDGPSGNYFNADYIYIFK